MYHKYYRIKLDNYLLAFDLCDKYDRLDVRITKAKNKVCTLDIDGLLYKMVDLEKKNNELEMKINYYWGQSNDENRPKETFNQRRIQTVARS